MKPPRVYKRFPQATDANPRVVSRGQTIDTDAAPTIERYRRPIAAAPRGSENEAR
jgi:hypothetical protein